MPLGVCCWADNVVRGRAEASPGSRWPRMERTTGAVLVRGEDGYFAEQQLQLETTGTTGRSGCLDLSTDAAG